MIYQIYINQYIQTIYLMYTSEYIQCDISDFKEIKRIIFAKHKSANTYPQYQLASKWGIGSAKSEGYSRNLYPCYQVSMMVMVMLMLMLMQSSSQLSTLRDVGREDGGMYQCIAGNEEEESQAAAQLVLGGKTYSTRLTKWVYCKK